MNIDQSAMYYISMDLTRQALQTKGKLFSNFKLVSELVTFFWNNSGVGFMQARWGRHLCWTGRIPVNYFCADLFQRHSRFWCKPLFSHCWESWTNSIIQRRHLSLIGHIQSYNFTFLLCYALDFILIALNSFNWVFYFWLSSWTFTNTGH